MLTSRRLTILFAIGLAARLPGLLFNGQRDGFEMILDWGADVRALGLARGFSINYGVFSHAAFGIAAYLAEAVPRFWWLPFKVIAVLFEIGVLAALLRVSAPSVHGLVLIAYWLNPWFIWHGAYQGFWEGPHLLFGLLSCLALRRWGDDWRGWMVAGVLLFVSWQFKPQGLLHFAAPVGVFLCVLALRGIRQPLLWYSLGFLGSVMVVSGLFWLGGGPVAALADNFRSSAEAMPLLSSGGVGIWRFLSFAYMKVHGLPGEVYQVRMPVPLVAYGTIVSLIVGGGVLLAFVVQLARRSERRIPVWMAAYLTMAAGALIVSQFGARAHINHTYGAMVLLIPLLGVHRRLRSAWIVAALIQTLAHVSRYAMGTVSLLPPDDVLERYGHATSLSQAVRELPAFTVPDVWLRWQQGINDVLAVLPGHETISILSLAMFVAAVIMVMALFDLAQQPETLPFRAANSR